MKRKKDKDLTNSPKTDINSESQKWKNEPVNQRVTAITTILIALFTACSLVIGYCQFDTYTKSTNKQLRAYIGLEKVEWIKDSLNQFDQKVIVKIKNFGQTPAESCRTNIALGTVDPGHYYAPIHIDPNGSVSILSPSQIQATITPILSDKITTKTIDSVVNGNKFLYVVGLITYRDIFGNKDTTEFSYYYEYRLKQFVAGVYSNRIN